VANKQRETGARREEDWELTPSPYIRFGSPQSVVFATGNPRDKRSCLWRRLDLDLH